MKNKDRDHSHRRRRKAGQSRQPSGCDEETPDGRRIADRLYGGLFDAMDDDEKATADETPDLDALFDEPITE